MHCSFHFKCFCLSYAVTTAATLSFSYHILFYATSFSFCSFHCSWMVFDNLSMDCVIWVFFLTSVPVLIVLYPVQVFPSWFVSNYNFLQTEILHSKMPNSYPSYCFSWHFQKNFKLYLGVKWGVSWFLREPMTWKSNYLSHSKPSVKTL